MGNRMRPLHSLLSVKALRFHGSADMLINNGGCQSALPGKGVERATRKPT